MSYHILHQFDEQWLAELKHDTDESGRKSLLDSFDGERQQARQVRLAARESRRWAIVAASILLSAFALLYSIDADRRAEALQQRLDALEQTASK